MNRTVFRTAVSGTEGQSLVAIHRVVASSRQGFPDVSGRLRQFTPTRTTDAAGPTRRTGCALRPRGEREPGDMSGNDRKAIDIER